MKGSEFHGTLNTTCGMGLVAVCPRGSAITRATGGGMTTGPAAAPGKASQGSELS